MSCGSSDGGCRIYTKQALICIGTNLSVQDNDGKVEDLVCDRVPFYTETYLAFSLTIAIEKRETSQSHQNAHGCGTRN